MSRTLPIPPESLRFMGEDEKRFLRIGDLHVSDLRRDAGLTDDSSVLDIGSGYGRILIALERDGWHGTYTGIDILPRHIKWCQEHLGDGERVRFLHADVHNDRYNPRGRLRVEDLTLDVTDVDIVVLTSVFTHMWPGDIETYLRLAATAIGPAGSIYATFFLLSNHWRKARTRGATPMYDVAHEHTPWCRYMDRANPLHVIAYEESWVEERAAELGLRIASRAYGSWPGVGTGSGHNQDVLVLRRTG